MADLKPLGSEKLTGDDKLKRILELTYYKNPNNKPNKTSAELVSESKNGTVYGIVKEKDGYYVKKGINESSLDYIGGLFMKNKNKFSSYNEALKRLELLKGQETLQEAKKYVLKQQTPQQEAPMPSAPMGDQDLPPLPPKADDQATSGGDMPPMGDEAPMGDMPPMGDEAPMGDDQSMGDQSASKRSDYMAEVQKFAGKLGQELRDQQDRMESDDIKYVLNMIISAVDLDKLDLDDLEEIGEKFERDEEGMDSMGEEPPMEDEPLPEPEGDEPPAEEDLSEVDSMDALESFINTPINADEIDLSKYADLDEMDYMDEMDHMDEDYDQEIDLEEIKADINRRIGETLSKYFN
jgi:hypothetical protein